MAPHELYIWSSKLLQIPLSYFFWYTHTNLELVGTQGTFSFYVCVENPTWIDFDLRY